MMENGTSLSDLAAVSNMNNDGFGNSGFAWIWILLIFCIFGGGFGNWNNNNNATSSEVQSGFNNQNVMQRFDTIGQNQANAMYENSSLINSNKYDNAVLIKDAQYTNLQNTNALNATINQGFDSVNYNMNDGFRSVDKSICQTNYNLTQAMNNGFNDVNQSICNLSHQISDGVCAIKTQMLQDKYDNLLNEYNLSTMANANATQTQNILGAIGSWYAKPPYVPPVYYGGTTTV